MLSSFFVMEWPWWAGGMALGLFIVLYTWTFNRLLGMSSTMENALAEWKNPLLSKPAPAVSMDDAVLAMIREQGLNPADFGIDPAALAVAPAPVAADQPLEFNPRLILAGIFLGALIGGLFQGHAGFSMGPAFEQLFPVNVFFQGAILLGGGFLIGFGARMAGGCPSGHALGGLSVLSPSSLVAIAGYFVSGITLTLLLRWLIL